MKLFNRLVISIIILIVTVCSSNIQWGKDNWKNIIKADGKGNYAYLPAVFIYHDLNFSFFDSIETKYPNPPIYYDYRIHHNGTTADKYFAGTAAAILPFFLAAHAITCFIGFPADGYSKLYLIGVNIAAIFYLLTALIFVKKILKLYEASDALTSFLLIAMTFATNVFYYTVCEPAMSHIYSFAFITMFIYYMRNYFLSSESLYIIILGALLGIITFIRPVNVLIILIAPFISGDKKTFNNGIKYLKTHISAGISAGFVFLSIVSVQLLIYKLQTGCFWIDSYGSEKFNWNNPRPFDFLFSFKKGLFIYTPIAFLSLLGFGGLFKQNKFQFYSLAVFLLSLLYVLSSWWSWWYGGSFSSRVCIDYYAVMCLLICFAFNFLKTKRRRILYSSLILSFLILCQIQTYQYRYYFIHWEKMDKQHYWNVFMRVDLLKSHENPNDDLLKEL